MTTRKRSRTPAQSVINARAARLNKIQVQLADLSSRMGSFSHGLQYGGDRDLYAVGGYPRELNYEKFRGLYDRDPLAGQIVDVPAETTWRKPPEVTEKDVAPDAPTAFMKDWTDIVDRLGVWRKCQQVDTLARIGQFAVMLIGANEQDDRLLAQPLTAKNGSKDLLYLSVFGQKYARIATWTTSPTDPNYGRPEKYDIDLSSGVSGFKGGSISVHHTRVIHVAEGLLDDEVYGREALRRVYNDLHDFQKIATSTAEGFWQRVAGILQAITIPQGEDWRGLSDDDLDKLEKSLQELFHDMRKTFVGQGVKLERLAESEPNPEGSMNMYLRRLGAGSGIPSRILFGSETGERASTEDWKGFYGSIEERQLQHAEPAILRPLINRLLEFNLIAKPTTIGRGAYLIQWPKLAVDSDLDRATASRTRAETAAALTPVGGDPLALVDIKEQGDVMLKPFVDGEPPREIQDFAPPADGLGDSQDSTLTSV